MIWLLLLEFSNWIPGLEVRALPSLTHTALALPPSTLVCCHVPQVGFPCLPCGDFVWTVTRGVDRDAISAPWCFLLFCPVFVGFGITQLFLQISDPVGVFCAGDVSPRPAALV